MDANRCPICTGVDLERSHTFSVEDLVGQYRRQFSVDIGSDFGTIRELHLDRCLACDFRFFSPPMTGSEKLYESLQENEWYYLEGKPEFATARRFIRPTDRVLDVGCGSGAFAKNHPAANYVGLEFTARSVAKARDRGLTVLQQGIEQYALSDTVSCDAVCAFQVLEHVGRPKPFIEACIAVCRSGGKIIFSTPNADAFFSTVKNSVLNFPPHHTAWFSKKLWLNLPNYFPLRLVELVEEPLETVHRRFYADTLCRASLERLLRLRATPLIDNSLRNRLIGKIAHWGGGFLALGMVDPHLQPKGQSITAIYEKR